MTISHGSSTSLRGSFVALACVSMVAGGCKGRTTTGPDLPDVRVNTSLEMTPPIAKDVQIRQLRDSAQGNVLMVANFGRDQVKSQFHAVEISTGKVVLRDDGRGGDEAANDGLFSVALTEDLGALERELSEMQKGQVTALERRRPAFVGRELMSFDKIRTVPLDLDRFRRGGLVHLDPRVLCLALTNVSAEHSLMVTNLGVVEDPARTNNPCAANASAAGAWSFGKLMTDMANSSATGVSPEDFVRHWLDTWLSDATVNGDVVPSRTALFEMVIKPWIVRSGGTGSITLANWKTKRLNLRFAPFKLTAIVNRLDLRGNMGYGMANAGEGRFIFEVLAPDCTPLTGPGGFTVIFEYGLPLRSCAAVKKYAQDWNGLQNFTFGTPGYNDRLQALTDVFATANADPAKPNGSALNQIRTNELAIGRPWELREFVIDAASHFPELTTVKQEPAKKYNAQANPPGNTTDVAFMANWVNANANDIIHDRHTVPAQVSGQAFLGGKSHTEFNGFWDAFGTDISDDEARHHFSLNTCSGCHGGETGTSFLQVDIAPFGVEAQLAGFLTGTTVVDPANRPAGNPKSRSFNDLERRRQDLEKLLCTACARRPVIELTEVLTTKPLHMTH